MKHAIIYIKYVDSAVYHTEFPIDHPYALIEFEATGWLINEDDKSVIIAREVRHDSQHTARAILVIPKVAILERKTISPEPDRIIHA